MNYFIKLFCMSVLIILSNRNTVAIWIRSESDIQFTSQDINTPNTQYTTTNTPHSNSDSLPSGVTKDWLNSLRDESGRRIVSQSGQEMSRENSEEPETDAMQRKIFNSLGSGNFYGHSVSTAGDVNGDGHSDVIVGAIAYSSNTGRAYIYFGGQNMNTAPDVVLTGEATGNYFGYSVSTAGDVNGDGYSDVIVGAYGNSSNTGKTYIFFGGSGMNNNSDVTMSGQTTGSVFGISVSTAGDVNGDGYSDVIAGASGYTSATGRAYIFFGGSIMNNIADVTMTGEASGNFFGTSVTAAGDVNADGYSDVMVGADGYFSSTGRAYIFLGGSVMNNTADVVITGEATANHFGYSVSTAGDVNGDGYSDVVTGADGYSTSTGRVYIFFGGAGMNNVADVIITGETTNNLFGWSVSTAGDVNGDGYSDVIAGAYGYSSDIGRAYIFFGGSAMNSIADVILTGEATGSDFGLSVSEAGDANGDGYSDVIVGASGYGSNAGRVYLYDYFMKNEIRPDLSMTGEGTSNSFGLSVSSAGDVNGDGYSDVIVGAYGYSSGTGRAYIYFGGPSIDNTADITMTGEATINDFGYSVSSAGDVNGDGYSDVIVGAYGYSSNTGRAYIYFGGSSMNNIADVTLTGGATNIFFGRSVSSAGDVNGDGYSDVIAGAAGYSSNTGRAYVYYGGASMNNTADLTMTGETTSNYFGTSVSSAGDVNGDGFSDVIVGAYAYSTNTGRVYVYYGGASMNSTADVTMTGEAAADIFGISVSSAGDVNGDGYSDVIVGAEGYFTFTGRAYVYFGGTSMNNTADVSMTGEATYDYFGESVSSAGDVNGDGYSDVIIGADAYSTNTGRAYVYFGGASMNNTSDVTMTGEATYNSFGTSVSTAGDVNGDGYLDMIVGADEFSSDTGRTYLYLGSAISSKPILNYVKDVPNDQGGFVDLKWARSSYDVIGFDIITYYIVERSAPPIGGNFAWVNVAEVPSNKNAFYSYLAATPFDSSSNSNGSFFFRITARTSIPSQYWRSSILSGRSIDNIAPLMVSPFTTAPVVNNVLLNWNRSSSPDLLNYVLYRSTSPKIDPDTEPVFATTTDSTYLDTAPLSGTYYYFIVAQDIQNNKSPVAVAESPGITLNLTMFIEGFYNSGTDTQVSDTIKVYLRNSVSPFAKVDTAINVVSSNGTASLLFGNAPTGQYYIVTTHRNSLETWSKSGGEILTRAATANYDFSNASSQAFGNNMKPIDASPERFAVFSGDVNQDGFINLTDVVGIYNDAGNFVTGYKVTDVNGDSITDLSDIIIANNNSVGFVTLVRP